MIINLSTAFALRCVDCGYFAINEINIFQLNDTKVYKCDCGTEKFQIGNINNNNKEIAMKVKCKICNYQHKINLSYEIFMSKRIKPLICPETNRELGYFGPSRKLKNIIRQQEQDLNAMADKSGYNDFVSPGVLLDILNFLHDIAARGDLSCACGSQNIFIDLFSDSIRLYCNVCDNAMLIPAANSRDLEKIKSFEEIKLDFTPEGSSNNSRDPWINI